MQMKLTKVGGTVYMLEGAGGNIGVSVGEDGIVLVDDQFAPLAPKIREALKGLTDKPIKFVLNTHFHGDHTGGNAQFGAEAPIIAQENVRKRLKEGGAVAGSEAKPAPKEALPVITFNDRATVHLNGEDIRAIHFPHGHTDGDSIIFFPQSNVVHMGDDFVTYGFPFVDVRSGAAGREGHPWARPAFHAGRCAQIRPDVEGDAGIGSAGGRPRQERRPNETGAFVGQLRADGQRFHQDRRLD